MRVDTAVTVTSSMFDILNQLNPCLILTRETKYMTCCPWSSGVATGGLDDALHRGPQNLTNKL